MLRKVCVVVSLQVLSTLDFGLWTWTWIVTIHFYPEETFQILRTYAALNVMLGLIEKTGNPRETLQF